jgi:hypothetical protein
MIKKTVTFKDLNGKERTETHYFHFYESEIMEMELGVDGGFAARVQKMIDAQDQPSLIAVIKKFVLDAYGVKSDDGRQFIKNDAVRAAFVQSPAYSKIFMELVLNDVVAAEFVKGVVPDDMKDNVAAAMAAKN